MTLQVQFLTLLSVIASGIIIGFFFDGYRVLKSKIKLKAWFVFVIDVLYGVVAGILIFLLLLQINNGQLRLTYYIFFLLGIWFYYKNLSAIFIKLWLMLYELIYQGWLIIINIIKFLIIKPIFLIYKVITSIIYLIISILMGAIHIIKKILMPILHLLYSPLKNKVSLVKRKMTKKEGILSKIKKIFKQQ